MKNERDNIRGILAANIRTLNDHVEAAWSDELSADDEQRQLSRLQTLSVLAREYRLLARDADVDEMEEGVDLLQEALEAQRDR